MSQDALNFIHEINTQNDCLKIKVRIVRIWKQSFSLDMILMDEKGKKIQGTIKAKLIHNFERFLAEGSIVVLSNFGVAENSGNYRIINHPCKLNFYHTTTVKKIEVFDGPVYRFGFVKFHDINNKKIGDEFAIDVIGGVVSCGNMDVYDRNGKEGKWINFEMQDLEGKVVNCTLWDNFAQELSTFVNANKNDGCVIIIIQFARVRLWKGIPTIQNGLFGSKLFINDNLKDIIDFKKRLISKSGDSSSQQFSQLSCQTIYSMRDEFLVHTKRMSVDEISEVRKELKCVVLGTIKSIKEEEGWYYLACRKCNCKAIPKSSIVDLEDMDGSDSNDVNDNTLFCRTCQSVVNSAVPRFKVVVRVQDGTVIYK
ncbi:hypothetical protein OSB04_014964 [Centaurea solstitialis]|uniref:Replication protein A 70 kDa DNA-binding subunit B/D first OB fold domain-containing protein n=1 Tax=Centaurea solstitialis TaxID=347529 RepID=A0AA38SY30_9ASTR|nr:hypothetical protein OSB04_014964 [Centaurea solstitialis]